MGKQVADTLAVVRPPDGLGKRPAHVNDLELGAPLQLVAQRHRVGDDHLGQHALIDVVNGRPAQDPVRHDGNHLASIMLLDHGGRLGERATRVCHVVYQDAHLVNNVADEHHAADLVRPGPFLVNKSKGQIETVGERGCALGTAGVRGDDDAVFYGEVLLDPAQDGGLGIEVIDRDVEEALDLSTKKRNISNSDSKASQGPFPTPDLRCVQIHGNNVAATSRGEHVRNQSCALHSLALEISHSFFLGGGGHNLLVE